MLINFLFISKAPSQQVVFQVIFNCGVCVGGGPQTPKLFKGQL